MYHTSETDCFVMPPCSQSQSKDKRKQGATASSQYKSATEGFQPDCSTPPETKRAFEDEHGNVLEGSDDEDHDLDEYIMNPLFPNLPLGVPLTYTLTMHACLSVVPGERPNFSQVCIPAVLCTPSVST